jgi:hypothetical protein
MPQPPFIVEVRPEDEIRWEAMSGRAAVEEWFADHDWDADDLVSGSLKIACWPDGYRAATVYMLIDGRAHMYANRPLVRSLPEGVGVVRPAPQLD